MKCFALALLVSATLAAGWDVGDSFAQNAAGAPTAADIAAGKVLVEQQCKGCHGLDGKSVAPGIPSLAGQRDAYLITALREYRQGQRVHAALRIMAENLNEAGERNVAAYFASLPPAAPAAHIEVFSPYAHGKELSQACTQCHGENGNSVVPGTPSLSGQQPNYFIAAIQEYLSGARETPTAPMHTLIRNLKAVDFESLSLYFASQTPAPHRAPTRGDIGVGQSLTAVCGGCHGFKGESTDSATPNLAGQDPEYLVAALKAYRAGRAHPQMQRAVAALVKTDADAENIAAFYAVQQGAAAVHGETLIQDIAGKCNRCHSTSVDNPSLEVPNIRGQDMDYLIMALRSYRDGRRESSAMHNMTLPYGDSIIQGIASYYASQPPG